MSTGMSLTSFRDSFHKNNACSIMTERDEDEIDLGDDDHEDSSPLKAEESINAKPQSKAAALKLRLRQLKHKMNQARQLNQLAVREEGEHLVLPGKTHHNVTSKQAKSSIPHANSKAVLLAQYHGIDPQVLMQPASDTLARAQRGAEKAELQQYDMKDYHNPEGQFRNYQRNVQSLPQRRLDDDIETDTTIYDPTVTTARSDAIGTQRAQAHRVAVELHRRIDKRQRKERKRKESEIRQEGEVSSGINLRNQRFNAKIQRTLDEQTQEIRHNLERGTAL
jgi:SYF2 splicing factor